MAEKTGIQWTRSSFSPWWGCTEVSPGCDNCYARALDNRHRLGHATHWGAGVPRYRTSAANWKAPLRWNKKAAESGERWTVFPSMCDPFDNEVPDEWRTDFFRLIATTPALTWLLLTKRIGNVAKMLHTMLVDAPPLGNVWIGASVVNREEADRDINKLLAVPAVLHFVSYEPALAQVNFAPWLETVNCVSPDPHGRDRRIDWLIVGGESSQGGVKARPFDLAWARSTVAQCKAAGVPVFVKQLGSNPVSYGSAPAPGNTELCTLTLRDRAGADPAEWPADLRVQEIPA